jgi:hypothetical protein
VLIICFRTIQACQTTYFLPVHQVMVLLPSFVPNRFIPWVRSCKRPPTLLHKAHASKMKLPHPNHTPYKRVLATCTDSQPASNSMLYIASDINSVKQYPRAAAETTNGLCLRLSQLYRLVMLLTREDRELVRITRIGAIKRALT